MQGNKVPKVLRQVMAVIRRSLNQSVCYHLREIRQTVVEFNVSEKENFMPEYKHKDKFHGIKTPSPPPPQKKNKYIYIYL